MEKRAKILLFLLIMIVFLSYILITLNHFTNDKMNIQKMIGNTVSTSNLTINEYVTLSEKTIGLYFRLLQEQKYDKAYALLSPFYREIVSLEAYKENVNNLNFSDYQISQMIHETENMYAVQVEFDNRANQMLVILGEKGFYIVPEPFLKYDTMNQRITKDGISCELIGYQINMDNCIFDIKITNNSKNNVTLSGNMVLSSGYQITSEKGEFIVEAGNSMNVSLVCESHLVFPSIFQIVRKDEKKDRIYEFKLD